MTNFPLAVVLQGVDRLTPVLVKGAQGLGGFAQRASKLGTTLTTAVTLPVLGVAAAVAHTGLEWDRGWREIGATLDLSAEQLEQLRAVARATSDDLGGPSGALAVMHGLVNEGADFNAVLTETPAALNLVKILGGDAAAAMDLLDSSMGATGATADQTARFVDVLVNAAGGSPKKIREMGEALKVAGGIAEPMGVRFEELAAVLGQLDRRGVDGKKTGLALYTLLQRLEQPGKNAIAVFERLGIERREVFDDDGKIRDLIGFLETLQARGATARDFLTVFGARAGPSLARLLGEGIDGMRSYRDELDRTGLAEQRAAAMTLGAAGGYEKFTSGLKTLAIAIGESGMLDWLAQATTKTANWLRTVSETNPELLRLGTALVGVAAAAGPVLKVLSGGLSLIEKLLSGASKLSGAVGGLLGLSRATVGGAAALAMIPAQPENYVSENARLDHVFKRTEELSRLMGVDQYEGSRWWEESGAFLTRRLPELEAMWAKFPGNPANLQPAQTPETNINVRFENAPPGTRARVDGANSADVQLNVGYSLGN